MDVAKSVLVQYFSQKSIQIQASLIKNVLDALSFILQKI